MARFEGESGGEKKEEEDEALMLTFPVASGGVLSPRLLRIIYKGATRARSSGLTWGRYARSASLTGERSTEWAYWPFLATSMVAFS